MLQMQQGPELQVAEKKGDDATKALSGQERLALARQKELEKEKARMEAEKKAAEQVRSTSGL